MAAYYRADLASFVGALPDQVVGQLSSQLIERFTGSHQDQLRAWKEQVSLLQTACARVMEAFPTAGAWGVLLEYPLLRLQRRLDTVALAGQIVAVIEFKIGANRYNPADARQVEDYALDLRDFHAASRQLTIVPVLCAPEAPPRPFPGEGLENVWPVHYANLDTLVDLLRSLAAQQTREPERQLSPTQWDSSPYRPVPTIVQAAELLYAGHQVQEITNTSSDAVNLAATADRLVEIVRDARGAGKRVVCFVTGIPGSGKTLTGLNLVHDPRLETEDPVKAAYLSGNTPLVEVLREALARDRSRRTSEPKGDSRRVVRTEIQHLMDYLREYITENPTHCPPEHVIVFDEAQRAWDAAYGRRKFGRAASEPALFIDIMGRHRDWAVIVALVGGGQEINVGEGGLAEWGNALQEAARTDPGRPWEIVAAPDVAFGGQTTLGKSLFPTDGSYLGPLEIDAVLHLSTSVRSYRCEALATWVDYTLSGLVEGARALARATEDLPVFITRTLPVARSWLRTRARGERRVGLVASSGARRLRADGLGVSLSANDRMGYVHWYLEPSGDIRSSNALEVTANEYTCQGLELDYLGVCWGGDMLWSPRDRTWSYRELSGRAWKAVRKADTQNFVRNSYRVLLTRARLGIVVWVPYGDPHDPTRSPQGLDDTAAFLVSCGARPLAEIDTTVERVAPAELSAVKAPVSRS